MQSQLAGKKGSPLTARTERRLNRETELNGFAEDPEIKANWKAANLETASIDDVQEENARLTKKVMKLKGKVRNWKTQFELSQAQLHAVMEEKEAMKRELEGQRALAKGAAEMEERYRENLVDAQAEIGRLEEQLTTGEYPIGYGQEPSWRKPYLK